MRVITAILLAALAFVEVNAQTSETIYTATSANVAEPGSPVTIRIQRWSTMEEATPLVAALNPPPARRGGGPADGARAAGAGRAGGRGARGRGRGAAPAAPLSPGAALAQAIGRAPTIGYLWTADVTGYSIKYAYRTAMSDGGERVILASDRRLGTHTAGWQPTVKEPLTDYEFTIIEIRFDGKGVGEGRTSLTTKVVVDADAKTVALESYQAAPAILRNVKASEAPPRTGEHGRCGSASLAQCLFAPLSRGEKT
jgi:hypothetical protein